jgi:hypothetical protein
MSPLEIECKSHSPHLFANTRSIDEAVNFGLWISKEGYRDSTINTRVKALKQIMKNWIDANIS